MNIRESRVQLIAEIGINHNGSSEEVSALVQASAASGAHAVKFQYRNPDRAYVHRARELGDEIVRHAISSAFVEPADLCRAADLAQQLGMRAGISFFSIDDMPDILELRPSWDFFKVPSAELANVELNQELLRRGVTVFVSTGAHSEAEITSAFEKFPTEADWVPLHCVSNYPTHMRNARLGYLQWLKGRWNRPVGYSSHDIDWEICLAATLCGAEYIERHITLDKEQEGLDHSSSSTPDEFATLARILAGLPEAISGNHPRSPNQGELANRQNLGRSYFFRRDIARGETIGRESLVYASPRIALDVDVTDYIGKAAVRDCAAYSPLDRTVVTAPAQVSDKAIDFCNALRIGIPVRPHDQDDLLRDMPLCTVEYHLSFGDVEGSDSLVPSPGVRHASVHMPDYISPTRLMDPFADDLDVRSQSLHVLDRTATLAARLQDLMGDSVPVVGSFPSLDSRRPDYLLSLAAIVERAAERGVQILPQWLPPYAWYFGGSVPVHALCDPAELDDVARQGLHICLDTAHLAMSCTYVGSDLDAALARSLPLARHIHLGDATGIDGEGVALGHGDVGSSAMLPSVLRAPFNKVIEVWQGHLSGGEGFKNEITNLYAEWGAM
jgi:sialic acid synthase SpsE/sugar phosphate isomerase/epimerase